MSECGAATAGSNKKIVCKQLKDLHRTRSSLTATTEDRITAVQDTTEFRTTYESTKRRERKKKESSNARKKKERRKCKSTRLTNLNGFFKVHES
jgi:hypothetical protein